MVAAFALENKVGIKADDVETLTDYLETLLLRTGQFSVVPRSELEVVLRQKKSKSFSSCYDEQCQIEIGKELAANKVLRTILSRIGRKCLVAVVLYDLRTSTGTRAGNAIGGCKGEDFFALVEQAVGQLAGASTAPRDTATEEPEGGSASLSLLSEPVQAVEVVLNGVLVSRATPFEIQSLPLGSHQIELRAPGFRPYAQVIHVTQAQPHVMRVPLERLAPSPEASEQDGAAGPRGQ